MFPDAMSGRLAAFRPCCFGLGFLLAVCTPTGSVLAEPPITSPQDAYCRNEARARVFSTPDPQNAGLHEVGRRLYQGCMGHYSHSKSRRSRSHRHGRRHRR